MTSNCPPQLQLSLQPNTTSFKRSFEQFGFDLESPVEGSGGSSNDGNDRNKRARSESSFSDSTDSTDSSRSSMLASGSSSGSLSPQRVGDESRISQPSPPRLPSLAIEDIDMPDYPSQERHSTHFPSSHAQHSEDIYRLSSESLNSLGSSTAVRRQRTQPASPPGLTRIPSPPPVLPPLAISEDQPRLSISTSSISFLHTPPRPPSPLEVIFGGEVVTSPSALETSVGDSEMIQGFRARLASALERLTPQSPLVPGLDLDEQEEQLQAQVDNNSDSELQESAVAEVPANPPTLPPIPSIITGAEIHPFNIQDILAEERSLQSLSSASVVESSSSSSMNANLDIHPLPSPIFRDLPSWMDEPTNPTGDNSRNSSSSRHSQSYPPLVVNPMGSASNPPIESSHFFIIPREYIADFRSASGGSSSEDNQHSSRPPQDMGLWERNSFEFWPSSGHGTTHRSPTSPNPSPPRPPSPRPTASRPVGGGRSQSSLRLRPRPASSISLVTENSLEARRRADHDHVMRDLHVGLRQTNEGVDVEMLSEPPGPRSESARENIRSLRGQDPERPHRPFLHLSSLPAPRLDVAANARGEPAFRFGDVRPSSTLWHASPYRSTGNNESSGHHEVPQTRASARHSVTRDFISNPEPSSSFPSTHSQPRPTTRLPALPMDFLASASNSEWRQHDSHSSSHHVDDERLGSIHWPRPMDEPPPSLPPPDFGHAFETGSNDRDVEMRTQEQSRRMHELHHHHPLPPAPLPYMPQRSHVLSEDLPSRRVWPSVAAQGSDRLRPAHTHQLETIMRDISDLSALPENPQPPPRPSVLEGSNVEERRYPWELPRQPVTGDNRRPPRFPVFPPPRTTEERGSTSVRPVSVHALSSSGLRSRTVPNIVEDRIRYRDASPLRYRPEPLPPLPPPPVRFHPSFVAGDVDRQQQQEPVATFSSSTLDPSEFAPGPFRNTINQSFHRRANRPTPPTIPPLSFEETGPPSHYFTEFTPPSHQAEETASRSSVNETPFVPPRRINPSSDQPQQQRVFGHYPRYSTLNTSTPDTGISASTQRRIALHRHLTHQLRMEPSRLDTPFSEGPLATSSDSGHRHPLPPHPPLRIDPIRPDGDNLTRQFQLIEYRYQEVERRRRSISRNEPAPLDDSDAERPTPPPVPPLRTGGGGSRRFGGVDLENLQHSFRTRRRLRLPTNFLSNSRMMGNSGDFVHDDDFDDSYENLLNLASTLGDVKSKSTPRDVIERLQKGKYKDWKSDDDDKRCPICLDDYTDQDTLLKLSNCHHWFHQGCLQQWLHSANTCPVCRNPVQEPSGNSSGSISPRRTRRFVFWRGGGPGHQPPSPGNGHGEYGAPSSSTRPPGSGNPPSSYRPHF